jgi:two-component system response regulator PilR (NtrC family)
VNPANGAVEAAIYAAARLLVGRSITMVTLREVAATVAKRRSTVMILGETGSGKENVARYIHARSERAGGPFVPVDCTTLADGLFESEMFGHVRGAFTGAVRDGLGIIRSANGGTLFLDELGELSLPMQAKLLRVLQERRVTAVGDTKSKPVDIRVLCATNRDLQAMVHASTFREDLYYRLNVIVMQVPPLRARLDDVADLAQHFLHVQGDVYEEPVKTLSPDAAMALAAYAWPGNVRELANVMEHAHVLARTDQIALADLPPRLQALPVNRFNLGDARPGMPRPTDTDAPGGLHLATVERRTIAEALRRCRNNKAAASRMLGINIQRLNRRIIHLNVLTPES